MNNYDFAVIGGGPGGIAAAKVLAENKKKVLLIEKNFLGGTCLNRGCIPTKTFLEAANLFKSVKKFNDYGLDLKTTDIKFDFNKLKNKKEEIIEKLRKGLTFSVKKSGVEIIFGNAQLLDEKTIKIDETMIKAEKIILATGGISKKLTNIEIKNAKIICSDEIFFLEKIPKSICIIGGGAIGLEWASFFHAFGAEVNIIESKDTLLAYFDQKIGDSIQKTMEKQGIKIFLKNEIKKIEGEKIQLKNNENIKSEIVLAAIGHETDLTYLNNLNLKKENNRLWVNNDFQTSSPDIYAIGDLIGKCGTAYGAEREGKNLAYKLLNLDSNLVPLDYGKMPNTVFTIPEIASLGEKIQELEEQKINFNCKEIHYLANGKATIKGETEGKIWLYYEKESEQILGCHIIGALASEIIHVIAPIIHFKLTLKDYLKTVVSHPVFAELIRDVMLQ